MFIKPFRVKAQTQVKGSDRKRVRTLLLQQFETLTAGDAELILPNKEVVTLTRIYCSKGESVNVYLVNGDPMFFHHEKEKTLYPSIYMLWQYPDLLPITFRTELAVVNKLVQGADLMLPGVVVTGEMSPTVYGRFEAGASCVVRVENSLAAVAVGLTAHCSMDMYMAARRGRAVTILHVYGDYLWQMGTKKLLPDLPLSDPIQDQATPAGGEEEAASKITADDRDTAANVSANSREENTGEVDFTEKQLEDLELQEPLELTAAEEEVDVDPSAQMDDLLLHCFLKALKTSARKVDLPILTSSFFHKHMLPARPDNTTLNVKKSRYKKLSKFLEVMADRGVIKVQEYPKGVENITSIEYAHELLVKFVVNKEETTVSETPCGGKPAFCPPILEEVYQVSGDTIEFFRVNGISKGTVLTMAEVRQVVTNYIKDRGLQKPGQNVVEVDPILHAAAVSRKEGLVRELRWDQIFSRLLGRMSPATKISRNGYPSIVKKGKLEPIEMTVSKRTGNKKVTLVYNVGNFGIDEAEFAHQVQVGVAASTTVGPADHKPQGTTQVLVQGNQVIFISKLLLETYNIPRKYIKGLELVAKALKGKK